MPASNNVGVLSSFFASNIGLFYHYRKNVEAEFALVVALHCINEDVIDQSLYSSIVLAILLSTVIAPFSLRYTINKYSARGKLSMSISGNDKLKELEAEIKSLTSEKVSDTLKFPI